MKIWPPENAFSGGQIDLWEQRDNWYVQFAELSLRFR